MQDPDVVALVDRNPLDDSKPPVVGQGARRADKTIVPETDDASSRSFVLWFETLPSGDTAQVHLLPYDRSCGVVGQWNGRECRTETCATVAEAERLAWRWWNELPNLVGIGSDDLVDASSPWM